MKTAHRPGRLSRLLVLLLAVTVVGCTAEDRGDIRDQIGGWFGGVCHSLNYRVGPRRTRPSRRGATIGTGPVGFRGAV